MNKTFIAKTTRLVQRQQAAYERYSDLDAELVNFKSECDHRTPDGKLWLRTKRVPKRGSMRAYTYRACRICEEAVDKDCYGRHVSVWNHLDIPEERKRELEKIMGK